MTTKTVALDAATDAATIAANIDAKIASLDDWRGATLARVRKLIREADPAIVEEWKWDIPVWSHAGIVCTGEVYKAAVKLTFAHGAKVPDPAGLFNASLEGNTRRAIDLKQGAQLDDAAFKALIVAAGKVNEAVAAERAAKKSHKAQKA